METNWLLLIGAATAGSLVSLIGGFLLISRQLDIRRVQLVAVPFAAGALLAAAFFDLIPEAFELGESAESTAGIMLLGFMIFFVLERTLGWFHHHHEHETPTVQRRSAQSLIVIGDILHNAIDGLVIGAAFLVDPVVGIVTTAAVAAHEIPQELGDFGVLLSLGMPKRRVIVVNLLSAVATVVTASLVFAFGDAVASLEAGLLAFTAGLFIYIAASDLIPTIHAEPRPRAANLQAVVLFVGIIAIGLTTSLAHSYIGHDHEAPRAAEIDTAEEHHGHDEH